MPPPNDEKIPKITCKKRKKVPSCFRKKRLRRKKWRKKKSAPALTCLPTYRPPVAVSFFGCPLAKPNKTGNSLSVGSTMAGWPRALFVTTRGNTPLFGLHIWPFFLAISEIGDRADLKKGAT